MTSPAPIALEGLDNPAGIVNESDRSEAPSGLKKSPVVTIILPAHNEAETIRDTVLRYFHEIGPRLSTEFIVAEDGSDDGTREILSSLKKELPIVLLTGQERKGYAKGVRDALRSCNGEFIFFSDSDGQYSPKDFWKLWEARNGYDLVIGRKVHRNEAAHRVILAEGFHRIVNFLFHLDLHDADCGFRLLRKNMTSGLLNQVHLLEYSFWAEFTIRASLKGFRILEVPIQHNKRLFGETHIYKPTKIPFIVLKQLRGLTQLYFENLTGL